LRFLLHVRASRGRSTVAVGAGPMVVTQNPPCPSMGCHCRLTAPNLNLSRNSCHSFFCSVRIMPTTARPGKSRTVFHGSNLGLTGASHRKINVDCGTREPRLERISYPNGSRRLCRGSKLCHTPTQRIGNDRVQKTHWLVCLRRLNRAAHCSACNMLPESARPCHAMSKAVP